MTRLLLRIYLTLLGEFGPQHWWPGETRDEIIVGAILTQNTNWTNVEKAISNLRDNQLLSLPKLAKLKPERLAELIRPSGYYNQKASRLISVSDALCGKTVPSSPLEFRAFLLSLQGVGPETADSILLYAYGLPIFVIDAYTRRILIRLGLIQPSASYAEMQALFMQALEPDPQLFNEYHALLVRLGKTCCRKIPDCTLCPLREICLHAHNQPGESA